MLDNLYENIGRKIKNWAKWIFIVEAIGAIITGFVLLCLDEDFILYGLLAMILGPFVAWVGSWILYAFGELVEDVHALRSNSIAPTYTTQDQVTPPASAAPSIIKPATSTIIMPRTTVQADEWKCTCGRIHKQYVSTCSCGASKHEAIAAQNNKKD